MSRVVVCTGGTGGHVFPALALCEQLSNQDFDVELLTDMRGRRFCYNSDVKITVLPEVSSKLYALARSILNSALITSSLAIDWQRNKPDAVVVFGGIISIVPSLIALSFRIPVIVHEQNVVIGKANALLARICRNLTSNFKINRFQQVCTPVRREIKQVAASHYEHIRDGKFRLTIIGGSQGASIFSYVIPQAISMLPDEIRKSLAIVQHASGKEKTALQEKYESLGVESFVVEFIRDVPDVIAASSLVICRSGASTLNELATIGRPAILVPYPYAADDHQAMNAIYFQGLGAGYCVLERDFSPEWLARKIEELFHSPDTLRLCAVNMLRIRGPQANSELVSYITSTIGG